MRSGDGRKTPKGEKMPKNDHCMCMEYEFQRLLSGGGMGITEHHSNRCSKNHHGHQGKARIDLEYIQIGI